MRTFEKLNIHPSIIKAIKEEGYENLTAIQKKIIPIANKAIDVIGASKSGTGKTLSFVAPILQRIKKISNKKNRVLRGLILVPTRELALQIETAISKYGKYLDIKYTTIQGGITKNLQIKKLDDGVDLIIATTGRLKSMIEDGKIDISSINTIVIDEADTMLEMSFLFDIEFILSNCSKKRQIMMFSATISQNIRKLAKKFLTDPVVVEISQRRSVVGLIKHRAFKVDLKRKNELLADIIKKTSNQVLVFANTQESANTVFSYLYSKKIKVAITHGGLESKSRNEAIKSFKDKKIQVLIATDIAGRGIDIKELSLVINYELPEKTDDFTHRVGRTGRANQKGEVISLLGVFDYNHFTKIERDLKLNIKREVAEGFLLKDRQPRQRQAKKSKKKKRVVKKIEKTGAKSKKTTKRDRK